MGDGTTLTTDRIVRDQANKTLEAYLQRVRKFSQTMPDSVLPPPETAASNAPRMSTPQQENSWAGWAISSFTNKLTAASGEIQPNSNGVVIKPTLDRSASTPPARSTLSASPASQLRPSPSSTPSAPAVPRVSSNLRTATPVEDEGFGDDWGAMDDGDDGDAADAWGDPEPEPVAKSRAAQSPTPSRPTTAAFDDQGEPDFAGWLNAQAQAKGNAKKKPLPKGLSKAKPTAATAPAKPAVGARTTVAARPAVSKPAAEKKANKPAPATPAVDEDDDWGEAWG